MWVVVLLLKGYLMGYFWFLFFCFWFVYVEGVFVDSRILCLWVVFICYVCDLMDVILVGLGLCLVFEVSFEGLYGLGIFLWSIYLGFIMWVFYLGWIVDVNDYVL